MVDQLPSNMMHDLDKIISDLMSVNNLLPNEDDAVPYSFLPDQPTRDAVEEMQKRGLSEVPVLSASGEVLGVFSFRMLAVMATKNNYNGTPIGDLPIDEFLENARFVPVEENISSVIGMLLQKGYLVVGTPKSYQGLLTLSHTAKGLHQVAQAFILMQHIELLLRAIIRKCVPVGDLVNLLRNIKAKDLDETTFGNLRYMIKDNWTFFEGIFGQNSYDRTMVKLKDMNEVRNAVFHFNDQKGIDLIQLQVHRDWLVRRAKHFNAMNGGESHE